MTTLLFTKHYNYSRSLNRMQHFECISNYPFLTGSHITPNLTFLSHSSPAPTMSAAVLKKPDFQVPVDLDQRRELLESLEHKLSACITLLKRGMESRGDGSSSSVFGPLFSDEELRQYDIRRNLLLYRVCWLYRSLYESEAAEEAEVARMEARLE